MLAPSEGVGFSRRRQAVYLGVNSMTLPLAETEGADQAPSAFTAFIHTLIFLRRSNGPVKDCFRKRRQEYSIAQHIT